MIGKDTVETAHSWYVTGVGWIEKEAFNLGITYLERAIPVFEETGDELRVIRAKHHRLLGLQRTERHDEVETDAEEVLRGYARLGDTHGKALLHAHLAESIARLTRWERAMMHLNLGEAIAAPAGNGPVLRYILERQARLFLERESSVAALRLLKRAEAAAAEEGLEAEVVRFRGVQGNALARMGERSEAVAILEDAQRRSMPKGRYREALESLSMLSRIYESTGQFEELNRTKELMHLCGQGVLKQGDGRRRHRAPGEPAIDPEVAPESGPA